MTNDGKNKNRKLLTIKETSKILQCSETDLKKWCKKNDGPLRSYLKNGERKFKEDDVFSLKFSYPLFDEALEELLQLEAEIDNFHTKFCDFKKWLEEKNIYRFLESSLDETTDFYSGYYSYHFVCFRFLKRIIWCKNGKDDDEQFLEFVNRKKELWD